MRIQVYRKFRFPSPTFPRFFITFIVVYFAKQKKKTELKYLPDRDRVLYYNVFFI